MTPELIQKAHAEIEAAMFDANGNGPWIDHADNTLRKRHVIDQAMILGYALGMCDGDPEIGQTDARFIAWKHLLERFARRNEGVTQALSSSTVYPPDLYRVPRPASVIPGGGGFRRRSRDR